GIRDSSVTGVQTCALPISLRRRDAFHHSRPTHSPGARRPINRELPMEFSLLFLLLIVFLIGLGALASRRRILRVSVVNTPARRQIGRASCRESGGRE